MTPEELFTSIKLLVKTPENYVPRNYETIGGMWTTDTWKLGDVVFLLMDEGYTEVIRFKNRSVVVGGYHGVQKDENTASILEEVLTYLKE